MWSFVFPFPDGRVFHRAIGGRDLAAAYETFRRDHWTPTLGAVGVWQNNALIARIRPEIDNDSGDLKPELQELGI